VKHTEGETSFTVQPSKTQRSESPRKTEKKLRYKIKMKKERRINKKSNLKEINQQLKEHQLKIQYYEQQRKSSSDHHGVRVVEAGGREDMSEAFISAVSYN